MRSIAPIAATLLSVCLLAAACSETSNPTTPSGIAAVPQSSTSPSSARLEVVAGGREIRMLDQCEPDSFNAAIGPGTCIRNGGVTFDVFIALLQKHQVVPSWRFSPDAIHVPAELNLPVVNVGGEAHTFTEVEEFGGGIVPVLNNLSGTPVPAPECLSLTSADFIAPGAQTTHTFEPGEADKYQCCIHPWMRATTK